MVELGGLVDDFRAAAAGLGLLDDGVVLDLEHLPAPHRPPTKLRAGCSAVYVFSLSQAYGETVPAGPNRVLKVGKAGANSSARFCSHHYNPRAADSVLAKSLLNERLFWSYLGINVLDDSRVKEWMCEHLERDHVFVSGQPGLDRQIERYLCGRLGPVFEGGLTRRASGAG